MQTRKPGEQPADPYDVAKAFAKLAQQLPHVQMVVLQDEKWDVPCVWTVFDAPRLDRNAWSSVINVELDILKLFNDSIVEFRYLNVQELTDEMEHHVPSGHILFRRKTAA